MIASKKLQGYCNAIALMLVHALPVMGKPAPNVDKDGKVKSHKPDELLRAKMLKVQVVVPTYNHAQFIAQTLDSILMQKTEHEFKILLHDDASTDGTRDIVQDYATRHPDRFECILQEENQFQQGRRIATLVWPHYRAEYIAYLDGDDHWTSPHKLQVQIDYMDRHPRCMISQTLSTVFDSKTGETIQKFPGEDRRKDRHYFEQMAPGNFLLSSAVMHRLSALPELPSDFGEIGFGDYAKFALAARTGWIGLIHEEMTKYRVHENNMWFGKSFEDRISKTRHVQEYIARHAPKPFDKLWICSSREEPVPFHVKAACKIARRARNGVDRLLEFAAPVLRKRS